MLTDLAIGAAQAANYFLLVLNYRAVAQGRYVTMAATDAVLAAVSFYLIRHVAEASTTRAFACFVVGGVLGSVGGMWLSKRLHRV